MKPGKLPAVLFSFISLMLYFLIATKQNCQQGTKEKNIGQIEFALHSKSRKTKKSKSTKPDKLSNNVQFKSVTETKTHKRNVQAEGNELS